MMNKTIIGVYFLILIIVIVSFLLYSGSSILTVGLDQNNTIPSGTFITWAGIISLPIAIILGVKNLRHPKGSAYKFLGILLRITVFLAVLWVPVSYFLSGNLGFNFTGKDTFRGGQLGMKWFWYYSYGIVILPIFIWIIHCFLSLFRWVRNKD